MNHSPSRIQSLLAVSVSVSVVILSANAQEMVATAAPAASSVLKEARVTASSSQNGQDAQNVLDQNRETFWVSSGSKPGEGPTATRPEWLQFALNAPTTIEAVRITGRANYGPKNLELQASDDGTTFRTVPLLSVSASGADTVLKFAPVRTSFFRVVMRDANDPGSPTAPRNVQIAEVALATAYKKPMVKSLFDEKISIVDPQALVLGDKTYGPTHYGQPINGLAFQDNLTSFRGWQYFAFYNGERQLCLSRRQLPMGAWQTIRFSGYKFKTNDAHNVVSVGVSPLDGTIHLVYDGHGGAPTYFRISKPGVASNPASAAWTEAAFEAQRNDVQPGKMLRSITYPRFFQAPDGALQMTYREGGSGIGDLWMVDYDAQSHQWKNSRQIDTRAGKFTDEWGTSASRNSYANGFDYSSDGKLHTTWTWRENTPVGNRDIAYAYSEDKGFTWKNNAGEVVGHAAPDTAAGVMGTDSPGLVVVPISRKQGMINTQAQSVDSQGRVHIVMSHVTPESVRAAGLTWPSKAVWGAPAALRYHHYWRQKDGSWKHTELPFVAGARGWLGFDAQDNAYFVYLSRADKPSDLDVTDPYFSGDLTVAFATAKGNYSDWRLAYEKSGPYVSEFRGDVNRLRQEGVLSIMAQRQSPADIFTSELSVVDLKLKP